MAKLKAPLLSLGASGSLAKTLTFFPWKGIAAVRTWVSPSNPQTALQTTQRGYVTSGVAMVHTAQARAANALTSADQVAYSALAAAKGRVITWFNQVVKLWVDVLVAGDTPCVYSNGEPAGTAVANFSQRLFLNEETPSDLAAGKFYFGTSKTNLVHALAGVVDPGVSVQLWGEDMTGYLVAGTKYFVQFRPDVGDPCEGADGGIYYFVAT